MYASWHAYQQNHWKEQAWKWKAIHSEVHNAYRKECNKTHRESGWAKRGLRSASKAASSLSLILMININIYIYIVDVSSSLLFCRSLPRLAAPVFCQPILASFLNLWRIYFLFWFLCFCAAWARRFLVGAVFAASLVASRRLRRFLLRLFLAVVYQGVVLHHVAECLGSLFLFLLPFFFCCPPFLGFLEIVGAAHLHWWPCTRARRTIASRCTWRLLRRQGAGARRLARYPAPSTVPKQRHPGSSPVLAAAPVSAEDAQGGAGSAREGTAMTSPRQGWGCTSSAGA